MGWTTSIQEPHLTRRDTEPGSSTICSDGPRRSASSSSQPDQLPGAPFLRKRSASSRRCPSDVRLHRAAYAHLAGASDVPRARSVPKWVLRLAVASRERPVGLQPSTPGRRPAYPCPASRALRLASGARHAAGRGPISQPRSGGAPDAPLWYPGSGGASVPAVHDRQPSRPADRAKPPKAAVLRCATQHGLARGHHVSAHRRRLALPGRRPRSRDAQDRRLVHARSYADRVDVGRPDDGHPAAATSCWPHLSLGIAAANTRPRPMESSLPT